MNDDCLKLTTYFGERHRTEDRFVADALLDLYGRRQVTTSVMLRGTAGFGLKHRMRTDRLLTLSEDLPLVSVAVDTRERIETLLDEVVALKRHGLITLERARLLTGEIAPIELPEELHEATKLTIYVGRQERTFGQPTFTAVCELLHRHGLAGATVLLGVDGTAHGERERARFFGRNVEVPMMIIAVGSGGQITRVLPQLGAVLSRPLLTLERVRVCKRDGELLAAPNELPATDERGRPVWQKLMVYASEHSRHENAPLHLALLRRLRQKRANGATCVRGVWGFHGNHAPHGDKFFQLRRHVPVVTIIIDTPDRVAEWFEIVDELTDEAGLVTSEMVPAVAAVAESGRTRGGLRLARHRF